MGQETINVAFPTQCGGQLQGNAAAGDRALSVQGGGAINVQGDGLWRVTLNVPLPPSRRMIFWGPVSNTPVGGVSLEYVSIDDSTFYISLNDLTGAVVNDVDIAFEVKAIPRVL